MDNTNMTKVRDSKGGVHYFAKKDLPSASGGSTFPLSKDDGVTTFFLGDGSSFDIHMLTHDDTDIGREAEMFVSSPPSGSGPLQATMNAGLAGWTVQQSDDGTSKTGKFVGDTATFDSDVHVTGTLTVDGATLMSQDDGTHSYAVVGSGGQILMYVASDATPARTAGVSSAIGSAPTIFSSLDATGTGSHETHLSAQTSESFASERYIKIVQDSLTSHIYLNSGDPNGSLTSKGKGDLCIDVTTPGLFQATAAASTAWTAL